MRLFSTMPGVMAGPRAAALHRLAPGRRPKASPHLAAVAVAGTLLLLASPARGQSNDECLTCHADRSLSMQKGKRTVSLFVDGAAFAGTVHADVTCVGCHEGFDPGSLPHAKKLAPARCTSCHADARFAAVAASVHGTAAARTGGAVACASCHPPHAVTKLSDAPPAAQQRFVMATCVRCHEPVHTRYMKSDHGRALVAGVKGAPSCISCHGEHNIQSHTVDSAATSRSHEARMCLACHVDNPAVRERVGPSAGFIGGYEASVHGRAMSKGNGAAATCSDCHGAHEVKKGADPRSKVSQLNISTTCGECHSEIEVQYDASVHGKALLAGVHQSPTCTDCHGEHGILSPRDPASPVAATNVSAQVCSPCHASVRLAAKYGLAADRFQTFMDSYHGLANKAGAVEVANCASCHGVHDIRPSSDSTSRISKANLVATCGTCHPGANENFTRGNVHVIARSGQEGVLYIVSTGYVILIVVLIGGMAGHNILDFLKKSRRQLMFRRGLLPAHQPPHRLYLRMTLSERIQHAALLISFLTLVLTGFALRFPDAWWVAPIRQLSPLMFEIRGIVHRVAAVVMVGASLYHVYYLFFLPRGKQLLRDLLPVRQDLADVVAVLRYNLGLSRERPLFGRFSYIEKSEYWALVWGTIVMTATGLVLWFDNVFLGILTKLWWDVARTVHYYEAWLATLAIIVWHFYFVIFNPDTYPINLAFWKGTLTEEEMMEEHPLELQKLLQQAGDENPVESSSPSKG